MIFKWVGNFSVEKGGRGWIFHGKVGHSETLAKVKLKKTLIDRLSDCRAAKTQKLFSGRRPKNSLTLFWPADRWVGWAWLFSLVGDLGPPSWTVTSVWAWLAVTRWRIFYFKKTWRENEFLKNGAKFLMEFLFWLN